MIFLLNSHAARLKEFCCAIFIPFLFFSVVVTSFQSAFFYYFFFFIFLHFSYMFSLGGGATNLNLTLYMPFICESEKFAIYWCCFAQYVCAVQDTTLCFVSVLSAYILYIFSTVFKFKFSKDEF